MVRYIFDDIWCIQAGQENRVGELNCNAGSHDRQFPFQPTTVVVWTNLINLNESETWWSATDSMISFCTCPLTFSSGVFQGGRKGTHTTRYYELINKYAKDSYGGENDLGLRCKRHQKHSKTCSCLFGVMVQSGYFVGKMSMIQCGQLWAMRNYTNSCTVSKTAKPGGSSTSLWSQNPHSFGGKTHWCQFLEVQGFDQAAQAA